jgi:uncharacterized protein CbrC (UPF0167 family)
MTEDSRRLFPLFRYHPFPVYTKAIEPQPITCPACGLASDYSYSFTAHPTDEDTEGAEERDVRVCPWCLHDGRAARRYPGVAFNDPPPAADIGDAARDELAYRTPSYVGFQEREWPVHHGDYCAFIGYVGWREIAPYAAELAVDLARLRRQLGWRKPELESWVNGASVQGYLFRCTTCGIHRLTFDLD